MVAALGHLWTIQGILVSISNSGNFVVFFCFDGHIQTLALYNMVFDLYMQEFLLVLCIYMCVLGSIVALCR